MRQMVVELPSRTLTVFDPAHLQHRRAHPAKWMRDERAVVEEMRLARVVAARVDQPHVPVRVREGAPDAPGEGATFRLQVSSGQVFVGDARDLPSQRWGRRRWNFWDWAFALFLLSLVPFGMWMLGFDRELLKMMALYGLIFVAGSAFAAWLIFRRGEAGFARKSGTPTVDRPEQVVTLPPGAYQVTVAQQGDVLAVWFVQSEGAPANEVSAVPQVAFS